MSHVTRTRTGKLPRRVVSIAAEPTPTASASATEAQSTLAASSSANTAEAIAAAVMRHLEQSGRLLPVPPATVLPPRVNTLPTMRPSRTSRIPVSTSSMPLTSTTIASHQPAPIPSSSTAVPAAPHLVSDDSDSDFDALVGDLLGGESHTPMPTYSVVNRPLGANLSDLLKSKIRKGDYVNLQHLLIDDDVAVDDSYEQQQHKRLTLEVTHIGQQDALSLVTPSQPNRITTIGQWLSAFTVYAAVLTEHSPQLAPGIFKHISDITEMARRFGGLAWKRYDESFRRDMRANQLSFGQVNWDLRFRCLEQAVNKPGSYSFRGTNTRTPYNRTRGGVSLGSSFPSRAFQKGQCYQYEQFGSCPRPTCQFKHACAKCSGQHPTHRCSLRPARPQGVGRAGAIRPSNTNK